MSDWATFWAVDLHVHTPGSADAKDENFGSPSDIVAAAIAVGLDAIAITDHNTADWCDRIAAAAADTDLVVLPGVEISTSEGHLLAVWEQGTPSTTISELLVRLGIGEAERGKLDIAAEVGFKAAAEKVDQSGGIAIAAHVDKPKGLLKLPVAATIKRALLDPCLTAVEVFDLESRSIVDGKVGAERTVAYVQSSDAWDSAVNQHSVKGIGARCTWVKASRPDLVGLRHAFADPDLRTRLGAAPPVVAYPLIESVELVGGFLGGQRVELAPDLNALLGGTGAGKSLVLEAIRYALNQQVDGAAFPAIHREVQSRLKSALGNGVVKLQFSVGGNRYRVERAFDGEHSTTAQVFQHTGDDWVSIDAEPAVLIPIAAFSQGEVLEYSREPVGRMTLIDAGIDLERIDSTIEGLKTNLRTNGKDLLTHRKQAGELREKAGKTADLEEQVRELAKLFDSDVVKQQEGWTKEASRLKGARQSIVGLEVDPLTISSVSGGHEVTTNSDVFIKVTNILAALKKSVKKAEGEIEAAITTAKSDLQGVVTDWQARRTSFNAKLDAELEKVDPGA